MKKAAIIIASIILVIIIAMPLLRKYTKSHSPQDIAEYTNSDLSLKVFYSKPYKKDRLIFGNEEDGALVPYGSKWRTGANEATEIEVSSKILINDQELSPGRYSLYTIPGADQWIVAFNENTDYWGINLFGETFDESKDVLRVSAPVRETSKVYEQFQITFKEDSSNNLMMNFTWDKTQASLLISY